MKNFKKVFSVVLVSLMAVMVLVSCGPKVSPEDTTKIFLDVVLKDDKTNMDKIGIKEKDYTDFKKEEDTAIDESFKASGMDSSILTDDVKATLKSNILKGLSTLTYEVTPVSSEGNKATVTVKIKPFDMEKIVKDGQSKIMEKVLANPSMSEKEIYQEAFKIIGEAIAAGTVKDQPKSVTISLTKEGNLWVPSEDDVKNIMTTVMAG
ncbi:MULTISPECIES: DUF5105 domain-containing protein [Clostridium]|jgi:hypothetical protein|uniref:DUF5105 domain-containing protein n=1 Tax=Clostridium saccharoperbutylacetonicum N1-4(HMT) TaxID=931276 RepID=M1MY88_9CLOT|nr:MULTISPECIES: DUF5105 domain-containing protein [Clostridium]AGF56367.1 hypothetical protein Cspa_c26020 [Clostridium saccharoperbutylacetonicum N1-4(HMT)]AQR95108.1 hypothetical protein CLSAP_24220 [Clostridium saccharoperbutylacetonicum]NRT62889.1 hypothetical protein [Clostridium saccharoperbutylacetonicum]NSB26245.1 hypothetical protein [Clostridium saccharoperbutylacetonicum]NSB30955.1 hypothetical protein [Clostridium saccharoperbutylacetonicum]